MPYDQSSIQWLEDPVAEQEALAAVTRSRNTVRRLLNYATPEAAVEIATMAELNPTISPELATSAFVAGIPSTDDWIAEAARVENETTRTIGGIGGFFGRAGDILRGAVRWTALAFNGLYDEFINRPLRTGQNLMHGGMDLGEAYAASGNAPFGAFGEAIAAGISDDTHVNIGSGWLPQSELSDVVTQALAQLNADAAHVGSDNELARQAVYDRYATEFGYKAPTFLSPAQQQSMFERQMRDRIMSDATNPNTRLGAAQQPFGTPVTQRQQAEADSVTMNLNIAPWIDQNYSGVSIGRVFASLVSESGTTPFHIASGATDFMANIFMDPANALGGAYAKASKLARGTGMTDEAVGIVRTAEDVLEAAGVSKVREPTAVAARIDELVGTINERMTSDAYKRWLNFSPKYRQQLQDYADFGIVDPKRPLKASHQEAGMVMREIQGYEDELARLFDDPDLTKFNNYADASKAKLDELGELSPQALRALRAKNPRLASMYQTHRQAKLVQEATENVQKKIDHLKANPVMKNWDKWKDSTKARALEDADKATFKPSDFASERAYKLAANRQKTGREIKRINEELDEAANLLDDIVNNGNYAAQIRHAAGIREGARRTVDDVKVSQFLTGPNATRFVDELVEGNAARVDEILSHIKGTVPLELRRALADAQSRDEVIAALLPHLGTTVADTGMGMSSILRINSPVARMHRVVSENVWQKIAASANSGRVKPLFSGSKLQRAFSQMSPGHLDLNDLDTSYQLLADHAFNLGWQRGDEALEEILRRFTDLKKGDYDAAWDVLNDYRYTMIERLTKQGFDQELSRAVTNFIGDDKVASRYWQDNVGNIFDDGRFVNQGAVEHTVPPHLLSEHFKGVIHMPNPRLVRHAAAELDQWGRWMNVLFTEGMAAKSGKELFRQRVLVRGANAVMTRMWKPIVLLRVAWPVRVIGEEQARMAAAGISRPLTHPIQYISRIIHSKSSADVLGDAFSHADEFARASARRVNFQGDYQAWGLQHWENINLTEHGHRAYRQAMLAELNQLWSDPIVARLFADSFDEGIAHGDRLDEVARWLQSEEGASLLNALKQNAPDDVRKALSNEDGILQYLEQVYARSHQKAGGHWLMVRPDVDETGTKIARWRDDMGEEGVFTNPDLIPDRPTYQITDAGIGELTESFGTGKWRELNVAEKMAEDANVLAKNPKMVNIKHVEKELDDLILADAGAGQRLPRNYKGTLDPSGIDEAGWDRTISTLFDWLMSRPTNRLSRNPAFKEYYWRHLGEMAPFMDEATLAAARRGAKKAGDLDAFSALGRSSRVKGGALREFENANALRTSRFHKGVAENAGMITDLKQADEAAKAMALTSVQDLLFDVSKRKNISDAFSIITPFADAWGEVIGTWIRIMRQENIRPFRRFQQLIESGRESDPFNAAAGYNEGFFYQSGDREVFSLPFVNSMYSHLSGTDSEWEYSLEGMSIATDVIPAVGPIVQMVAEPIIPNEPQWDFLREYISPFGPTSVQRGLTPSHWQRFIGMWDFARNTFADEGLKDLYDGAVMDALAAMERTDPHFDEKWATNREQVLTEAKEKASQLFFIQGLARFAGPAAPSTKPTVEDKNGAIWQTAALSDEYYKMMQRHDGDRLAATAEFVATFGLEPFTFMTSKSTQVRPSSSTQIGYDWRRENPEIVANYPNVAYFLGPAHLDDYVPFDWTAYYDSIAQGSRERLTPDQWARVLNDTKGSLAYAEAIRQIEEMYGRDWGASGWPTQLRRQLANNLRIYDQQLMDQFRGYSGAQFGSRVEGIPERVSVDVQITELEGLMNAHPEMVEDSPALYAASLYLEERAKAMAAAYSLPQGSVMTSGQDDPGSVFFTMRQMLRETAANLIVDYPEFGPMWEGIFSREMYSDFNDEMTIQDAYDLIFGEEEVENG